MVIFRGTAKVLGRLDGKEKFAVGRARAGAKLFIVDS
jgi:hypothetical protein